MSPEDATQGLCEDHFIQALRLCARVCPSFSARATPLGDLCSTAVTAEPTLITLCPSGLPAKPTSHLAQHLRDVFNLPVPQCPAVRWGHQGTTIT